MSTVWWLIVFSAVAAGLCARSRAAGAALAFGVTAVVLLLVGTGAGEQLGEFVERIDDAARDARAGGGEAR